MAPATKETKRLTMWIEQSSRNLSQPIDDEIIDGGVDDSARRKMWLQKGLGGGWGGGGLQTARKSNRDRGVVERDEGKDSNAKTTTRGTDHEQTNGESKTGETPWSRHAGEERNGHVKQDRNNAATTPKRKGGRGGEERGKRHRKEETMRRRETMEM
jgi:hypothetical protein